MSDLLEKVKANLILEHNEDDELLERLILTALLMPKATNT